MRKDEQAYLRRRADDELAMAQRAIDPAAAKAHYELMNLYLSRLRPPVGGHATALA